MDTSIIIHSDDVIQHFGVKGMKWGVRRMYNNHVETLDTNTGKRVIVKKLLRINLGNV